MSYYDGPSGPSTNYAVLESRSAYLSDGQFAVGMIQYFLGLNTDMVESLVGRYVRGKLKGELRGMITWTKCVHGGWITGKGLCGRGVTEIEISIVSGWDRRRNMPCTTTVLAWTRANGISSKGDTQ